MLKSPYYSFIAQNIASEWVEEGVEPGACPPPAGSQGRTRAPHHTPRQGSRDQQYPARYHPITTQNSCCNLLLIHSLCTVAFRGVKEVVPLRPLKGVIPFPQYSPLYAPVETHTSCFQLFKIIISVIIARYLPFICIVQWRTWLYRWTPPLAL